MGIRSSQKFLFFFFSLLFIFSDRTFAVLAAEPTLQPSSFTANSTVCNEIDLLFLAGDGSKRIVIASANAPVSALPVDAQTYTAGSLFGSGSNLGNGNYVVYNQGGTSVTVTGLQGGTQYYFAIFEFNGSLTGTNYLLTNYPEANAFALGFTMTISSTSLGICKGDSVQLEAQGANIYQWSPSSTLSSDTDSVVWAKPINNISYNVIGTDTATGCTNSKSISISVYQLPNVSIGNFPNKCINAPLFTLTSGIPSGGTYSGNGVSNGKFNPAAAGLGQQVITYTYSDIHSCISSDTSNILVINTPNVILPAFNDVCINTPSFILSGGNPTGGGYSGTGVSSGRFYPLTAGVGQHLIRYVYSDVSGCSDTAEVYIRVRALPNVVFATLPSACLNTPPFTFTAGTPTGGAYSGNGVSNNQFSPLVTGAGTFLITYNYTDSFGCSSSDTSNLTIRTIPQVTFSALNSVCQNTGPVALSGGSPAGGSYSGNAVGSGIFYTGIAGPGQHPITYTYTDNFNCSNSSSQIITVNVIPYPNLGTDQTVCSNESAYLTAGTFAAYTWSTGSHTSALNVDTSGYGLGTFSFILTVTNNFNCVNRDTVLVTFDGCVGMNEPTSLRGNTIVVFPNPSQSSFTIHSGEEIDFFIYDLRGALLLERKKVKSELTFGDNLPPGTYILKILSGQRVFNKRIVKN